MGISVEYVAKETASNLWRNRVMALAAVLTVAVSLSLVGTALLLRQAVNRQVQQWSGNVSLQIFMKANATQAETNYVTSLTKQMSAQIRSCDYLDHQASYNLMRQLFAGQQGGDAIISTLTVATTPPVFRCQLVNPNDAGSVAAIFSPPVHNATTPGVPGVLSAPYPGQSIKALERLTNVLQLVLLVIALVLLASSLVLILNAIRMAIFARRQEIGVMKLVGATNWFIRLPFMAEGLLQGLVGALVAVVVVLLSNVGVHSLVTHYEINAFSSLTLPAHELVTTEVLVVIVGVVIGALGSSVAVRRFLDV
jgi:cell division transport system permease protein